MVASSILAYDLVMSYTSLHGHDDPDDELLSFHGYDDPDDELHILAWS